jgi:hypothetical protein
MEVSNISNQVSLAQARDAVLALGTDVTFILRGQPGIGKSWILKDLARALPDYIPAYIDCADLSLGDIAMPIIDREQRVTRFAPNERFKIYPGQTRPVLLMLDEVTKPATDEILNMLLPLMLERRLGDIPLPPGSIVFGTGNLDTDGVNDRFPAHACNRTTTLDVRNPDSEEWIMWAAANDVAPEVMAFVRENPQVMQRYDDPSAKDNTMIFNPLRGNIRSFCSPRSLHKASHIITKRDMLGDSVRALLSGTIGASAAAHMEAYVAMADSMPRISAIEADPKAAKLPDGVGPHFLCALMLSSRINVNNADAFITYVDRWDQFEAGNLFARTAAANPTKLAFLSKNREFSKMTAKFGKYIGQGGF